MEQNMISYKNTTNEIKDSDVRCAIIPVGSVEQHASHLPVGTDYMLAEEIGKALAEKIDAFLLPTLPFSTCYEHRGTIGSVCFKPETFYKMLWDLVICLKEQGFNRIIILSTHGGNFIIKPCIRELNAIHDDLVVVSPEMPISARMKEVLDNHNEVHAGEVETSMILYFHEELVKKDLMMENDCVPDLPQNFLSYAPFQVLSTSGAWGKPSVATKEKGKKIFEITVDEYAEYIEKAFSVAKADKWQK